MNALSYDYHETLLQLDCKNSSHWDTLTTYGQHPEIWDKKTLLYYPVNIKNYFGITDSADPNIIGAFWYRSASFDQPGHFCPIILDIDIILSQSVSIFENHLVVSCITYTTWRIRVKINWWYLMGFFSLLPKKLLVVL